MPEPVRRIRYIYLVVKLGGSVWCLHLIWFQYCNWLWNLNATRHCNCMLIWVCFFPKYLSSSNENSTNFISSFAFILNSRVADAACRVDKPEKKSKFWIPINVFSIRPIHCNRPFYGQFCAHKLFDHASRPLHVCCRDAIDFIRSIYISDDLFYELARCGLRTVRTANGERENFQNESKKRFTN